MSKIIEIDIKHYRGIKSFSQKFSSNVVCLIGRGDSSKTTVLEAIKATLSPRWNHTFYDTDFYQLDTSEPIEIIISLIDIPDALKTEGKFGLYLRAVDAEGNVADALSDEDSAVLTIKLTVDHTLEPTWHVITGRDQEPKEIKQGDRGKLNCFMISDYLDSHFSWGQGTPLYSLLNTDESDGEKNKHVLEAMRAAKVKLDAESFTYLESITDKIKVQAAGFGLGLDNANSTIDFKDISISEGKVSLHDGKVPFRLMGKGSRRIASIAIQTAVAEGGGIALIDELEQGLEPDRVRQIVRNLKDNGSGQVIITTHSREVITELSSQDLVLLVSNKVSGEIVSKNLEIDDDKLQGVIRACPEAFFAKKVIVCEGATEVGICRALDKFRRDRRNDQLPLKDCAYVDGTGHSFTERANNIKEAGIDTAAFCDSDRDEELNPSKDDLKNNAIAIYDCDDTNKIEQQVFKDLPWEAVVELIEYAKGSRNLSDDQLRESVDAKYDNGTLTVNWIDDIGDTPELREALAGASSVKKKEWFKRIDHGQKLGQIIFKYFDQIDGKKLGQTLQGISDWVDS